MPAPSASPSPSSTTTFASISPSTAPTRSEPTSTLLKAIAALSSAKKMVNAASDKLIVVIDDTKLVSGFNDNGLTMPVEVVQNHGEVKGRGEGEKCLL